MKNKKRKSLLCDLINLLNHICNCEEDDECCPPHLEGCIALNQGKHEIFVDLKCYKHFIPECVYIMTKPKGIPVCCGDINMVGYHLKDDGFVLYADIKSNIAEVCYIVHGKHADHCCQH